MNAPAQQTFRLVHRAARANALYAVSAAPDGYVVSVRPAGRSLDQSAKFHAICHDIARSGIEWGGCERSADEWKALLVVGHAVATGREIEIVPNLENGAPMPLRESTARMTKERMSSLLEYTIAWAASHNIKLRDVER